VPDAETDELTDVLGERRHLMNLAFRMLGSWNDAEDVVQQTYERWFRLDDDARAAIERPGAWLTTAASRICLKRLYSGRARRDRYVGVWLPEPVPTDAAAGSAPAIDPLDRVALDDSVSMALLIVLESLTPAERVAYVLHEVFAVPFAEIAEAVGRSPAATRQLAASARRHVRELRRRPAPLSEHDRLVSAFRTACENGDLDELIRILDPDVVSVSDGGGRVRAALRPVVGADKVARFILGVLAKAGPAVAIEQREVNGQTGFAVTEAGTVTGVVALGAAEGRIHDVWVVLNPDKLHAWNR
jgi:RNA polymerase sigma-70 factor (ECF subfamily)